ncbi:MAG: CPBP family intramembrane metalloprotease [Deltaproteobacteria bacterium]|nr:MAG: CPBP family intramembrane metalloprotease [Deltaproteobacteria bacterium]
MRTLGLLGLVIGILVLTAVASPWVAWGLARVAGGEFSFPRVYDRVFEVLLVVGVAAAWRRLDLGTASEIGFRRQGWGRAFGRGIGAGLLGLAAGFAACALAGALVPALRFSPAKTVWKGLLGLGAAGAIGVSEEVLFRGVLLRRLRHDAGDVLAVAVTTAVYAALHAVRTRGGSGPVHLGSGVTQTLGIFAPLAAGAVLPQLAGLVLLGLLLALARLRSGALWLSIGIHTGFVAGFRVGRLFVDLAATPAWLVGSGWPPLVGGAAGWLAVAVAARAALPRARA